MSIITTNFFPILCLCFTAALCECNLEGRHPWVFPERYTDYDKPFIEFTCNANLKPGEFLTWYKVSGLNKTPLTTTEQKQPGHTKLDLLWPLARLSIGDQIFCAMECLSSTTPDGEPIYGQMPTQNIPIIFNRAIPPVNDVRIVMVTPDVFVDYGKSFTEFTCWANVHQGDLLSWYQIKHSRKINLDRTQQTNLYGYIKIKLVKTFEPSDHGTQLYCAMETMLPNRTIVKGGKSQEIQIKLQRHIQPLEPPQERVDPCITTPCGAYAQCNNGICTCLAEYFGNPYSGCRPGCVLISDCPQNKACVRSECVDPCRSMCGINAVCNIYNHVAICSCPASMTGNAFAQCNTIESTSQGPWLTPRVFVDVGKPVAEFTCRAYLLKRELLTWNHINESGQTSILAIIQQKSNDHIEFKLRKTLEPSDNGTSLWCAKARIVPKKWSLKYERISDTGRIPLMFQRRIQALETPYVTIDPSSDVIIFDEDDELEFVCGGSAPVDGRGLWWYLERPDIFPFGQIFDKSTNVNRLKLPMKPFYHGSQLYCAQNFKLEVQLPEKDKKKTFYYGDLARSTAIRLLHRRQSDTEAAVRVTPRHFEDARKPFVEFTCYSFSQPGDVLSWYQTKGSNQSEDLLLGMKQLRDPVYHGDQWMELTLNKTLEQSDNGSQVYCAKVLPDDFSKIMESQRVPLEFQREIESLEPVFITVEPNTSVRFDVNTTLRLTCRGSKPVDGRTYSWFRIDSNSSLSIPEDQKYDASTTSNVLELSLNETYHQSQLYCAQGFISFIQTTDGSLQIKHYGELVTSSKVTLIRRDKEVTEEMNWTILAIALPLTVVALAVAAALWAVRRRRAPPAAPATPAAPAAPAAPTTDKDTDFDDYVTLAGATAQLTYAVLDLPRSEAAARAQEPVLYAEIAGVYRP